MPELHLIVGLGNPGPEYERTRHNIGFLVVDVFAKENGLKFSKCGTTQGSCASGRIGEKDVILLKPATFMNHSGAAIRQMVEKREIPLERMLVVCDDLNLDFGQVRIRPEGSEGGHNGLKSAVQHLKTKDFPRLRIGIGQSGADTVSYVLGEFSPGERKQLPGIAQNGADCCTVWLREGINKAMSRFNQRKGNEQQV